MATYNQLPVYKATYDLLLYVYQIGKNVQRDYRYTLGETLKKDLIMILEIFLFIYKQNIDPYLPCQFHSAESRDYYRSKGEAGRCETSTAPAARPETTVVEKLRQCFANDRVHIQTIVRVAKKL